LLAGSHIFPAILVFQIVIAFTIPIENISGKIGNRFSDQNRSAIFVHKSIPGFHFETGSRFSICSRDHDRDQNRIRIDRDPIFIHKSIPGFSFSTGSRFLKKIFWSHADAWDLHSNHKSQ